MMHFKLTFTDSPAGTSPAGSPAAKGREAVRLFWRRFLRALRDALAGMAA
jgi:hypothetical protein